MIASETPPSGWFRVQSPHKSPTAPRNSMFPLLLIASAQAQDTGASIYSGQRFLAPCPPGFVYLAFRKREVLDKRDNVPEHCVPSQNDKSTNHAVAMVPALALAVMACL